MSASATYCDVSIWHVNFKNASAVDVSVLSPCEKESAEAIKTPSDKALYILAHVRLREILGDWMNIPPKNVAFESGWNGQPIVKNDPNLFFSLSHSGQRAVIAVCQTAPLGVDIEAIKTRKRARQTAERFFTTEEAASLRDLPDVEHCIAFTKLWTFKEAFIKATGEGFARRLDSFAIDTDKQQLIKGANPEEWKFSDLEMPLGYAGALAVHTKLTLNIKVIETHATSKQHIEGQPEIMCLPLDRANTTGCTDLSDMRYETHSYSKSGCSTSFSLARLTGS